MDSARDGGAGAGVASPRFRTLAVATDRELRGLFRAGGRVDPEDVADTTWRGWNRHVLFGILRQRKFLKRFGPSRAVGSGQVVAAGENVLARQDGLERAWHPRLRGAGLFPFAVLPPGTGPHPSAPRRALVISYGDLPARGALNPVSRILDHVVRVPGEERLLLGESVIRLPGSRTWFLEYFLLEPWFQHLNRRST